MTMKDVEERTGLSRSNIRFYEKEKLIAQMFKFTQHFIQPTLPTVSVHRKKMAPLNSAKHRPRLS